MEANGETEQFWGTIDFHSNFFKWKLMIYLYNQKFIFVLLF